MSKFLTTQWDSNNFADEMCNKLFQNNGKSDKSLNNKANQKGTKKDNKMKAKFKTKSEKLKKSKILEKVKNNLKAPFTKEETNSTKSVGGKKKLKNNLTKLKETAKLIKEKIPTAFTEKKSKKRNKKNKKLGKSENLNKINVSDTKKAKNKIKNSKIIKNINNKVIDMKLLKDEVSSKDGDGEFLISNKPKLKELSLRQRMIMRLKASRFRYLNEQIYSIDSKDAQDLFLKDPESYSAYHEGYRLQVKKWPINPIDVIINDVKTMPNNYVIADFGCGDAKLSNQVQQKVHSFDLVAANDRVTACDMANVPLNKNTTDLAVFCLSLMGTNLHDYLKEANRVLKIGGILKIAEVESRFDKVEDFIKGVEQFGFKNFQKNFSHNLFYFMDFKKITNIKKSRKLPTISLHPCLYKKR